MSAMDPTTLAALRVGIAKWEGIANGTGIDRGGTNCALCLVFHPGCRSDGEDNCVGCPVRNRTGRDYCKGTPYDAWLHAGFGPGGHLHGSTGDEARALARPELDFLRSLLPEDNT